jgi:hypothetical protein
MTTKVVLIAAILILGCVGASFAGCISVPVYGWVTQMVPQCVNCGGVCAWVMQPVQVYTVVGYQTEWVPDGGGCGGCGGCGGWGGWNGWGGWGWRHGW